MFYVIDEPFWNAKNRNVSESEMYDSLVVVNSILKRDFPEVLRSFVEAYPMINSSLRVPPNFDLVGMDCYTGFENCEGKSIPQYYEILKSKMTASQKLVMIPTAIVFKNAASVTQSDRVAVKNMYLKYLEWAKTEPLVVASISFLYRYSMTTETMTGAENMCEVSDIHKLFWRKFVTSTVPAQTVICEGGTALIPSSANGQGQTNSCNYKWEAALSGQTISAIGTNGGTGKLKCEANARRA